MPYQLYIFDAHSGKLRVSEGSFLTVGAGTSNTFQMNMRAKVGGTFACKEQYCRFFLHGSLTHYSVNGTRMARDTAIPIGEIMLMTVAGGCFLCWFGAPENVPDFSGYNPSNWYVYDMSARAWSEAMKLSDVCKLEGKLAPDAPVIFEGLNGNAFWARDIMEASHYAADMEKAAMQSTDEGEADTYAIPQRLTCPHCWERFMPYEMLSIASHPDLMGDDILGKDAMQRFLPDHYNLDGIPLDAAGAPCRGTACPHCHGKLPPFLAGTHQHIISLVGAPYSGKTYLLATMFNEATKEFPREFDINLRDVDSKLSTPFNKLRQQLVAAETPKQAYFKNTEPGDPTTQRVWKNKAFHYLPTPITYGVSRPGSASCFMVFYDTPGSNFLPGQLDPNGTMGARHVDVASGYFFLFDPTLSRSFRRLIPDSTDPQMRLELGATNLQSQMLSELEIQLRDEMNMPPPDKLHVPLAIILDKSDVWLHLLGPEPLLPAVHHGRLQSACLRSNSERLRRLLFSIAPQVCACAEAFSDNVCYFAVSSLGQQPVAFTDKETGGTYIGPASGSLSPAHVTDPLLWVLSELEPGILPRNN